MVNMSDADFLLSCLDTGCRHGAPGTPAINHPVRICKTPRM